jgi:hypothetical protein
MSAGGGGGGGRFLPVYVLKPNTYQRAMNAVHYVNNNPIHKYILKLDSLVPKILNSQKLNSRQKMKRYTRLKNKLERLVEVKYGGPSAGAAGAADDGDDEGGDGGGGEIDLGGRELVTGSSGSMPPAAIPPARTAPGSPPEQQQKTLLDTILATPGVSLMKKKNDTYEDSRRTLVVEGEKLKKYQIGDIIRELSTPVDDDGGGGGKYRMKKQMKVLVKKLARDSSLDSKKIANQKIRAYFDECKGSAAGPNGRTGLRYGPAVATTSTAAAAAGSRTTGPSPAHASTATRLVQPAAVPGRAAVATEAKRLMESRRKWLTAAQMFPKKIRYQHGLAVD